MTDALVDTGADLTLFSQAYAAPLGLDLSSLPALPLTGAIGNVMTYRVLALVLELRRPPDLFRWRTSVGFVNGPMAYGVLGTKGFFEFFTMTYDAQAQTLDIVPNGPLPT